MEIRVTGLKEVKKLISRLPIKLKEQVGKKGTIKLAKNLQMRIRRRYTQTGYGGGSTSGKGHKSIIAKPTEKGARIIIGQNAPWLTILEEGARDHWVSPYTIQKHLRAPGSTIGKRAPRGSYGGRPIMWRWKGPFVEPAVNSFHPQIPKLLIKFVERAIAEAV